MKKPSQKRKKKGSRRRDQSPTKAKNLSPADTGAVQEKEVSVKKSSPVSLKKEHEKKVEKKESIFRYVTISVRFLKEAKIELKKVKWPTRKELLASTAIVIILVLLVSFFLGIIDFGLIKIIKNIVG